MGVTRKDIDNLKLYAECRGKLVPLVKIQTDMERSMTSYDSNNWKIDITGRTNVNELDSYISTTGTSGITFVDETLGRFDFDREWKLYVTNLYLTKTTIVKVIFNDPATIVFWSDGTKTVVKAQDGDEFDKMTGLAMCIAKKALGNKGNYYNEFRKWIEEDV